MREKSLELLSDLLKLARKFGTDEFDKLAVLLEDTEFRNKAVTILKGVAKVGADAGAKRAKVPALVEADPRRSELVSLARARISDTQCYPYLRDLNDELARLGLRGPAKGFRRREDALRAASKFLLESPPEQAEAFVAQLRSTSQQETLEEWSKIIMERKP
ncbi:MAG: hypothetical protein CSYNP_01615 [Syntrophus sp. SKADARSKE-3]|nr:hypothetical protein [Syntrophus sp. SKADARSKE-3]